MSDMYSPIWLNSNLQLPRDRATINAWCRALYALSAKHNNELGEYSAQIIKHLIQGVLSVDDMNSIIDELLVCGEVFIDVVRSPKFSVTIMNPDYVTVKAGGFIGSHKIFLRPDSKIISELEKDPEANKGYIEAFKRGQNYPVEDREFYHVAKRATPYDLRGESILLKHMQHIANNEDFTTIPQGDISKDLFNNRCLQYAALINACLTKIKEK